MCWNFRPSKLDFIVSTRPHLSLTERPSAHNRPSLLRSFCGRGEGSSSTVAAAEPPLFGRHSGRKASQALAASLDSFRSVPTSMVAASVEAISDKSRTVQHQHVDGRMSLLPRAIIVSVARYSVVMPKLGPLQSGPRGWSPVFHALPSIEAKKFALP